MPPKGIFDWIKIKWMFLGFAVTFGLTNFHRAGEVKWAFLKNHSITFYDILFCLDFICVLLCINFKLFYEEISVAATPSQSVG